MAIVNQNQLRGLFRVMAPRFITEEPAERARELPRSLATVDGNDPVPGTASGSDPVTRPGRTKTLPSLLSTLKKIPIAIYLFL